MDIKVLRNIANVARTGSITDAAEQVHVTVQALAAQLKKLEDHCGFKLFDRTNKGVSLTQEGVGILPHVLEIVRCSERMQLKIKQLRERQSQPLRVALNSTLSMEINQQTMAGVASNLSGCSPIFSCSESPDNLTKLAKGEADMVVILGDSMPEGFYSVSLKGLRIEVVACSVSGDTAPSVVIKPLPECPYASIFSRFANHQGGGLEAATVFHSGSEIVSVSMIKSFGGMGVLSRAVAEANDLHVWEGYSEYLDVYLVMKEPWIVEEEFPQFYPKTAPMHAFESINA
ncbi:LysR family transcriptional regulator [Pseudomonas fulva]|uniref:LysR family transcriptional regulator n=1 Tax=Pseudomonas fulva TaxID=47880 RepID=UPI001F3F16B7|nr:LysR family transcriptional regulator [Pseudomonas fulva]